MLSTVPTRRQGIFWMLTVPADGVRTDVISLVEQGELFPGIIWLKGQLEAGSVSGHLHYQILVAFKTKASVASIKKLFGGGVHAELSRSEAADAYVSKEDTRVRGPWEWGAKPIRRNAKVDWESVWAACVAGNLDAIPPSIRVVSYRTVRAIAADFAVPQPIIREVWVFWGRSQTGKSRRAWHEAGVSAYSKCPRSKFWDGYQDQEAIVIDEFRGGIDVSHILRWCDRYPVRVEIKGSSRPLVARKIWITSNVDPRMWYPELDQDTLEALLRRFNIVHFP